MDDAEDRRAGRPAFLDQLRHDGAVLPVEGKSLDLAFLTDTYVDATSFAFP